MADTLDTLRDYKADIDAEMGRFMAQAPTMFGVELSAHSQVALQHLTDYSIRSGKRIRGSLVALAYDTAAGTHHTKQGIQLGVVLELMQNYLLIIDDVMDRSHIRRGKPTLHELYKTETADFGGAHEADMLAINVGCMAQHLANLLLARIDVPPENLRQELAIMHTNIGITGFGQLDDLYQQPGRDVSHTELMGKYHSKSSYYTFVNPLQLGFCMAGKADKAVLNACQSFGEAAGIAFQLHDDYLGIFGDTTKLGKPNLDDVREGKYTFLVQYALEHAGTADVKLLRSILGNEDASVADFAQVQAIMESTGAKAYAVQQAEQFAQTAKDRLKAQPIGNPELTQLLADLVDYSITREH